MSNWKTDLDNFFSNKEQQQQERKKQKDRERAEGEKFTSTTATAAFAELQAELERHGRDIQVTVLTSPPRASIAVSFKGNLELRYEIIASGPKPIVKTNFNVVVPGSLSHQPVNAERSFRPDDQNYSIHDITKDEIIRHFLEEYKNALQSPPI